MSNLRDIKRSARRLLHDRMRVPALYLVDEAEPRLIHVRVHSKADALGAMPGGSGYAEQIESTPKLIFDLEEIPDVAAHAIVSVEVDEAYEVVEMEPPYGFTRTVHVRALRPSEAAGLPTP